jgi:hypothetical protein
MGVYEENGVGPCQQKALTTAPLRIPAFAAKLREEIGAEQSQRFSAEARVCKSSRVRRRRRQRWAAVVVVVDF